MPRVVEAIHHGKHDKFYATILQKAHQEVDDNGPILLDVQAQECAAEIDFGEILNFNDEADLSEASLSDELAVFVEEEAQGDDDAPDDIAAAPLQASSLGGPANFARDVVGERWGCFTITPVRRRVRGEDSLVVVGYQARCPFHKLGETTDCKKSLGFVRTQESRSDVLQRLFHWCTLALEKPRQRLHVLEHCPLAFCLPMEVLRARRIDEGPPRGQVVTDNVLDNLGLPLSLCPPASLEAAAAALEAKARETPSLKAAGGGGVASARPIKSASKAVAEASSSSSARSKALARAAIPPSALPKAPPSIRSDVTTSQVAKASAASTPPLPAAAPAARPPTHTSRQSRAAPPLRASAASTPPLPAAARAARPPTHTVRQSRAAPASSTLSLDLDQPLAALAAPPHRRGKRKAEHSEACVAKPKTAAKDSGASSSPKLASKAKSVARPKTGAVKAGGKRAPKSKAAVVGEVVVKAVSAAKASAPARTAALGASETSSDSTSSSESSSSSSSSSSS